jgi:hypothetical protein
MFYRLISRLVKFSFLVVFVVFSACKNEPSKPEKIASEIKKSAREIQLSETVKVLLLDSLSASNAIVRDDIEKFFETITPIDAAIQMQQNFDEKTTRDVAISAYKFFLKGDVSNFSKSETERLALTFTKAFKLCNSISPKIFPEEIKLVKSKGKPYGGDTYYTRENIIVVPEKALNDMIDEAFLKVILHEIAHIITRLNPNLKLKLYSAIGFNKIDAELVLPDSLEKRRLTNPDGINLKWATTLTVADNKKIFAVPLMYSKTAYFNPQSPELFEHMGWNFFEISVDKSGKKFEILTKGEKFQSTLDTRGINKLFLNNFNTDYIIHPDEIIADNFSILALQENMNTKVQQLTPNGLTLLTNLKSVLQNP